MTNANLFLSDNLFAGATNHRFLRNIIPRRCSFCSLGAVFSITKKPPPFGEGL